MNAPEPMLRIICGAEHSYACIKEGARTLDVPLAPGRGAAQAMREAADDLRARAERLIGQAELIERAEQAYTQPSLL